MAAGAMMYQIFTSAGLVSVGLFHLVATTRNHLKSPQSYSARPFHSIPLSSSNRIAKHLQLYLLIAFLVVALAHHTLVSYDSDPLLKGPVHRFTSLQHVALLSLFLLLSLALLLSDSLLPLPSDLFFALAAAVFFLHSSVSSSSASVQTSLLQAKCDSISSRISLLCSLLSLLLACQPRLFFADAALACSLCLQGLWALQTGLSLYVDAFIPEGCHRLLDVVDGVEGSTKCDVEDSSLRAVAILDLLFLLHVIFVLLLFLVVYGVVARTVGVRRLGSYEALPNVSLDHNHIQMKSLAGTQA